MSLKIFNNDSLIIDPIIFFEKIHHVFHTGENMTHGPSHLNFWLPYFTEVIENTLILVRNKDLYNWVLDFYPRWNVAYAKEYTDIDKLLPKFKQISHMYYSSNTGNTIHTLKYNEIIHVFLGHGDSDKSASAHKYFRVYDEVWVSGQAHIDRFKNAGFQVNEMIFRKVGRPALRSILSNNKKHWLERMELSFLYLPTWEGVYEESNYSSIHFSADLLKLVRSISPVASINAKLHPVTGSREIRFATLNEDLQEIFSSEDVQIADTSTAISTLLGKANIFICDISAVVSECLASDCPIFVYIPKDKDIIIAQSNMIYEDYCYTFSDLTELANLLDQVVLKNNDYLAEKRKIAIQYIISQTETENLTFEQLLLDISKKSAQKINLLSVNRQ
ncbi:CDP-glycerol glycerophosphotransferase family protein [Acinetobacter lwoffii]|uniref:CDP-glycerol glycerophosphotransferase family protein n=1 Tax=Acinetobacter lwoffii TaxID=28090 RepID=A0AAW8AP34_ACILW|nr:CDP-glycerol glycerophosphotransferase family protein [Acinetobacter lwoffii]MDP1370054.1 CDP-glycerol glycerophosphotransferase family protein [Acinetobacter lwoffii]MDP1389505.1 CDP-glycerol glycerophosphotransferase family protein [Acinetobacter lwoffii]MDP1447132.1 CDP-glycerol glycerophosphotransferase family protein [Acinetobacter lwoffii]